MKPRSFILPTVLIAGALAAKLTMQHAQITQLYTANAELWQALQQTQRDAERLQDVEQREKWYGRRIEDLSGEISRLTNELAAWKATNQAWQAWGQEMTQKLAEAQAALREQPPASQPAWTYVPQRSSKEPANAQPRQRPAPALQNRSAPNGTVLEAAAVAGGGTLTVHNGTDRDAMVKLVLLGAARSVATFYVRAGSSASFDRVPDGRYSVVYAHGVDWDPVAGDFTRNRSYERFDEVFDFATRYQDLGYGRVSQRLPRFRVTLHGVPGGSATTSPVAGRTYVAY